MLNTANILLIILVVCTSCAAPPIAIDVSFSQDEMSMRKRQQQLLERKAIKRTTVPVANTITGEVSKTLLTRVRQDLAKRLGHDKMILQHAAAVVWPSGALGCPRPGMNYTQALVNGYHVIYQADGKRWDYRLNEGGRFILCESQKALKPALNQSTQ